MTITRDLSGMRFGSLIAIKPVGLASQGNIRWLCKCDCGNEVTRVSKCLVYGEAFSCGCKKKTNNTHEMSKHRVYRVWASMIDRCTREKCKMYKYYGGRGISVCGEWRSFENFIRDMGIPEPGLQLDRIDNDGNYCKENCRWVTSKQNMLNRSDNHFLEYNGERLTITEWAAKIGMKRDTLKRRIYAGWPVEKAICVKTGDVRGPRSARNWD